MPDTPKRCASTAVSADADARRSSKKLRSTLSYLDAAASLEQLLKAELPDKEQFISEWVKTLASPSICITSLEDVKRLGAEDISALPVPPLVKGLFRKVIKREGDKATQRQAVLELTKTRAKAFLAPLRDRNNQPPLAGSKYFQDNRHYRLILTKEEIDAGVRIVSHRIETWCKGERIILVGILKGAFMLMSDLCRTMSRPYSVYFVEASSYKEGRTQGALSVSSDISSSKFVDATSKRPHKVVLIDELLDNGKTMQDMKKHLLDCLKDSHTENDILTCCLFSKARHRDLPDADITGIPNLPDLWLVGYGLDDRGTKRGWTELFAVPKVKLVNCIEEEEVQKMLDAMDDNGHFNSPHVFAGFELPFKAKCRYRISGVDTQGGSIQHTQGEENKVGSKADVVRALSEVEVMKGKYERELQFAFIAENTALVPEDEIFYGNNQVYAKMRWGLLRQIEDAAKRCGVAGVDQKLI